MEPKTNETLPIPSGKRFFDPPVIIPSDFRKSRTFDVLNGYHIPRATYLGIGCHPLSEKVTSVKDTFEMDTSDPYLNYGKPKRKAPPAFIPRFVHFQEKILKFIAYFKEPVFDSPEEFYRVRFVQIWYYLLDDTILVFEPGVLNSGLLQGKFLDRHQIPKNKHGQKWHWTDFDFRCDVQFYDRVFRIVNADQFTKCFYENEGFILNTPEKLPRDLYTDKFFTLLEKRWYSSKNIHGGKLKRYLEFGKKALRFFAVWDDSKTEHGSLRHMEIIYYLIDDCVEVVEILGGLNSGRLPFKPFLERARLPKNWNDLPREYQHVSVEKLQADFMEFYEIPDFKIGAVINVYGRKFLIYDMDECTKEFYFKYFGYTDFTPLSVFPPPPPLPHLKRPPWNGWGSPEDSIQSWLHFSPRRPKIDLTRNLRFDTKIMRFGAVLDSTRPEDQGREFVIAYRLKDDMVQITERPIKNSGWPGGKFWEYNRIMKPGNSKDDPAYYSPCDFYIGAVLDVNGFRFCIKGADCCVFEFLKANPDCYPKFAHENLCKYFECEKRVKAENNREKPCFPGRQICQEPIGEGFFEQLGLETANFEFDPCSESPHSCKEPNKWDICRKLGYKCGEENSESIDHPMKEPSPGEKDFFEQREIGACAPCRYVYPRQPMPIPQED